MDAYHVVALWDQEAEAWAVADSDVPGLATEAESWPALVENVRTLTPMLLRENASAEASLPTGDISVSVKAEQIAHVRAV